MKILTAKEKQAVAFVHLKGSENYTNAMQAPKFTKVVINVGIGSLKDKKKIETIVDRLTKISGQKPALRGSKKSIAAFDTVNETVLHQKIECAVNRDRRRSRHVLGELLDDLIGSKRAMAREQRTQHLPADRREFLPAALTNPFRVRERIFGAAAMVVIRGGESRLRLCHPETI